LQVAEGECPAAILIWQEVLVAVPLEILEHQHLVVAEQAVLQQQVELEALHGLLAEAREETVPLVLVVMAVSTFVITLDQAAAAAADITAAVAADQIVGLLPLLVAAQAAADPA
jgi:hypothetical protein